ncbi:HNH endonuclease [Agromyces albus]|uniref:HNH endonuclease n=1 Tax=Agromyces albus TaxID=205332 RepID=UPI0013E96D68|nr:HNH endonuclease [Agromyces albus]
MRKALDHEDGTRTCPNCGERQSIEAFNLDKLATGGRRAICKACRRAAEKRRWEAEPGRLRSLARKNYAKSIDVRRAKDKERYERDKDKRIALATESVHRRRVRMTMEPSDRGITVAALREKFGDICPYCGQPMSFEYVRGRQYEPRKATIEHIIPLSGGGGHTWANSMLCCWQCNLRKNRRTREEWVISMRDKR